MKWKRNEKIRIKTDEMQWHKWFAWYPVTTLDGYTVWLQMVYCRYTGRLTGNRRHILYWFGDPSQ